MKLSVQGERVLRALEEGRPFRAIGADWAAGPLRAPASLIDELDRGALVRRNKGGLALTDAGRARIARSTARARPARPARPARLLAERTIDDAGATEPPSRGARRSVTVNLLESPLGWLRARGLIDRRQFDAGERLRGDWTMAGLGPRVTMRWDAAPSGSARRGPDAPLDPTLAAIAAKRRFEAAVATAGKGLQDILWRVVCDGEGLEAAETALGWPKRSGKLVLIMALDRVADFYGLS